MARGPDAASLQITNLETQVHDILKSLHNLRNTLRPVNRLPPEIISYVARCTLNDGDLDTTSMIPLTHVCRYWRNSIISTPENWDLICSERRKVAEVGLERAKAAPLSVFLLFKIDQEFLDLLLPHAPKIASLSCVGFSTVEELIQTLPDFPKSMSNLQSLALTGTGRADWGHLVDPFDFSIHNALRELSLSYVPLFPSMLSLRTLTKFSLFDRHFPLSLDTLLNFLEENHSLESASLTIKFADPSLVLSERQTPVGGRLQRLSITGYDVSDIRALISKIALQEGAALTLREIHRRDGGLLRILSGVSTTHLPNLSSPTFMEYQHSPAGIRLFGPNGSFLYDSYIDSEVPFQEFDILPLVSIRGLHLKCWGPRVLTGFRLSLFPALEMLAIDGSSTVSFLSPMLPDPTSSPSLKTLAFMDCDITEDFLAHLAQIALYRERLASTPLHRIVIVDSKGELPPAALVERLRECVPVVEVSEGMEFPKDLL